MAVKLASGYIDLTVKYATAMRKIANDMTGVQQTAEKSGTEAGKKFVAARDKEVARGGKLDKALESSFRSATGASEKAGKQWADTASTSMAKHLASAQNSRQVASSLSYIAKHGDQAGKEFARSMSKQLSVDIDTRGASAELVGLRRNIENLGRSDLLRLNIGAAAITGLPMLASGLAEVAAALQQVSQAGLAVPGVIAGAASSIGTLMLGLTGVSDAYDALGSAADDAATSGSDMAATQRAQTSASHSLRNAEVDLAQARGDVARATRDARNELVDLNIEMRGGVLSEKRAVLEAQRAREELSKGGFETASDVQDALLRIEEADQRVLEVRARNAQTAQELNDANSKGVAGSDQVVAANERLVRAEQSVEQAQAAVAASAPKASAAQEKAALAMSKLHPEMAALVQTAFDFVNGPGQEFRNMLAGNIAEGLSDQLTGLAKKAMPTFEKGLGRISEVWNDTFTEMIDVLGKDENLSLLDRIFGNTAEAQTRLNGIIDPLVQGVGVLAAAGSDALPRMADALVTVSERFANFITGADADGSLATWIDEGLTGLGHLGETALNVSKMFTGITSATGGDLLANLEKWTGKWQAWLNSVEGQNTLKNIFEEGSRQFERWKPILEDLPGLFQGLYSAADKYMGLLLPVVDKVTTLLSDHPGLIEAAAAAYVVFQGAQVVGALSALTTSLTGINTMLGTTIPASANKAGTSLSSALVGPGTAVVVGSWGVDALLGKMDDIFGTDFFQKYGNVPGSGAWFWNQLFGNGNSLNPATLLKNLFGDPSPSLPNGTSVGQGPGANQNNGDALATGFFAPGDMGSREFAHETMWPFWENQGFKVGDHEADQYGEHQNGALDIMVPSIEEGQKVLQQVLQDPNVYGAIFDNQTYGYGHGLTPQDYSNGHTGDPNQDHTNHVHVFYQPNGDNNILPMPAAPPQNPALPASPRQPPAGPMPVPNQPAPPPPDSPLDDFWKRTLGPARTFDQGGPWPSGTPGINTTGKPEFVLTPQDIDYLKSQGIDPASIQSQSLSMLPDPNLSPEQQVQQWTNKGGPNRAEGYIPAGAGSSGQAGSSFASGLYQMGAQAINGLIDQAASAASSAVGVAAMGTPGAAQGAATAIGMGTQALKRGVEFGAQMAGIWTDAAAEIFMPFGVPRLFSTDVTSFMPQFGMQPTAVTTGEKAELAQQHQGTGASPGPGQMPGGPVQPGQLPGQQPVGAPAAPAQGGMPVGAPSNAAAAIDQKLWQQPRPPQPSMVQPANNAAAQQGADSVWKRLGIFDQGGMLQPGQLAFNASRRPEPMPVFNNDQWGTLDTLANRDVGEVDPKAGGGVSFSDTWYVTVKDVDELEQKMNDRRRRQMKRNGGRPLMGGA